MNTGKAFQNSLVTPVMAVFRVGGEYGVQYRLSTKHLSLDVPMSRMFDISRWSAAGIE